MKWNFIVRLAFLLCVGSLLAAAPDDLRVGRAFHAFDHLGNIGEQAAAAAASGANLIYATGLGGVGYLGLPAERELAAQCRSVTAYNRSARRNGIRVILGYLCATSIVKLESFDAHWSPEFRQQFQTPPTQWRQQGRDGQPLPSWYGGDYQPACMNHPDWRKYEKFMVRQQLTAGHDGIFFDNPTVHPRGCYCPHCMEKFAAWLREAGVTPDDFTTEALRRLADRQPIEFLRFRSTIARDFLAEMRRYARRIKPGALITCNNSLNSPEVLFSQARNYGYNIQEMSQAEDLVVVEDMSHQPRQLADGRTFEYGPTYRQLAALNHGKPIVAVTIAEGDYHTPPALVRLAMAEAAAHGASYLAWPTWPEAQRRRMATAIRPQADFLRHNEKFLNETDPRADLLFLLPFQRWPTTNRCVASELAAVLTRNNVQYRVVTEAELTRFLANTSRSKSVRPSVLLAESRAVLESISKPGTEQFERRGGKLIYASRPDWFSTVAAEVTPSVVLRGDPAVRVVIRDQSRRCLVHLYNLSIERLSSFEDRVHPAHDLWLRLRVPFAKVRAVTALTADREATSGRLPFTLERKNGETFVSLRLPRLEINTLLVVSP